MTLKLLVGYEGTEAGRRALAYIAPFAPDPTVEITLLTVAPNTTLTAGLFDEAARILGKGALEHLPATGSIYSALLQAAQAKPYDLAVFGELGRTWGRWARFRRRQPLSAALPISSLLVRGQATRITRALICAGGDESVIADARLTARLARRTGAKATILHVLSQVPLLFARGESRDQITAAFAATGAPEMKYMQQAAHALSEGGVTATPKVRVGLVVEEILDELGEGRYDLLVIGAHRSEGLVERLLLEDVAADILPQSPVPVLVVRQDP